MTGHFQSFRPSSLNLPPFTVHFHQRPSTFDLIFSEKTNGIRSDFIEVVKTRSGISCGEFQIFYEEWFDHGSTDQNRSVAVSEPWKARNETIFYKIDEPWSSRRISNSQKWSRSKLQRKLRTRKVWAVRRTLYEWRPNNLQLYERENSEERWTE